MNGEAAAYEKLQPKQGEQKQKKYNVSILMSEYSRMEKTLAQVVGTREIETRDLHTRISVTNPGLPGFEPVPTRLGRSRQHEIENQVRNMVSRGAVARQLCPQGSATLISTLARALDREEIERILELNCEISELEQSLAALESEILNMPPETVAEASQKLSFISCLMMDHKDFERDYFAFLIAECSEIVNVFGSEVWTE